MKSLGLVFFSLWLYFFNPIHIYNFISNIYIHRVRTRRIGTNNQILILIGRVKSRANPLVFTIL